jgi:drug/metabolite transporter (DMT)-like permease
MLGGSYPLTDVGLNAFDPLSMVFCRLAIGALVLGTWMFLRGQSVPRDRRALRILVAIGALNTIGSFMLVTWGQRYVTASYTAILVGSNPIFVSLGATLVLPDERLTRRRVIGILLGFAGVVCLFANELGWGGNGGGLWRLLGALAILGGAVGLAVVAIVVRMRLSAYSPAQVALPMMVTGVILMGTLLPILAVTGAVGLKADPTRLGPVVSVVVLGIVNAGIGNLVYYTLIRNWGVTRTALVGYVVPLIGVSLGVLLLHDPVGVNMFAGLALIVFSLVYVNPLTKRSRLAATEAAATAEI